MLLSVIEVRRSVSVEAGGCGAEPRSLEECMAVLSDPQVTHQTTLTAQVVFDDVEIVFDAFKNIYFFFFLERSKNADGFRSDRPGDG